MKAATIVPQAYLHLVKDQPYHLALAHLIEKNGFEDYTEFYTLVGRNDNQYLILDNGLIEGDPRPIHELVDKAIRINAQELVLPDVFLRKDATLAAIDHALEYVNKIDAPLKVMAVPQGEDFEAWLDCAYEILTWPVDVLGIPKVVVKLAGAHGRLQALQELQGHLGITEVHLLGCWETPLELKVIENAVRSGVIQPVRGTDSAIAYVYARENMRICDGPRPEGAVDFLDENTEFGILKYNIQMWQDECATLPPLGETNKVIRPRF